jgi:hypothetical protein
MLYQLRQLVIESIIKGGLPEHELELSIIHRDYQFAGFRVGILVKSLDDYKRRNIEY